MDRITVRIPNHIYKRLKEIRAEKPHMSLNALIVEAISESFEQEKEPAHAGNE